MKKKNKMEKLSFADANITLGKWVKVPILKRYNLSPEPKRNTRQRASIGRKEFAKKLGLTPIENNIPSLVCLVNSLRENHLVVTVPSSDFVVVENKTARSKKGKKK